MVRANAKKTEDEPEQPEDGPVVMPTIPEELRHDPAAYVKAGNELLHLFLSDKLDKSVEFPRKMDGIKDACEANTTIPYGDAAKRGADPVATFMGLMDHSEPELLEVEKAMLAIDDIRLTLDVKKKYQQLIHRAIAVQRQCRTDPAKCWTYVGRTSDDNSVFQWAPIHLRYFETWNAPERHSLVEAPPGHGKSTCLQGQIVWEVGQNPTLRVLVIYDDKSKPKKQIPLLKRIMRSRKYRALFPEVRVLGRADDAEDSSMRFTVSRTNWMSREPTFEGAAIGSSINGNRYDRIYGDDFCPPTVREHEKLRTQVKTQWLSVVEERLGNPKKSRIRIICTPWHAQDVNGQIVKDVEEGRLRNWRVMRCPIPADPDSGLPVPIWPERIDQDTLIDKKQRLTADQWALNYELRSVARGRQTIRGIEFYNSDIYGPHTTANDREVLKAIEGPQAERWLSIDPSGGSGKQSSDQGVIDFVLTPKGYAFILDVMFRHVGPVEMQEWIIDRIVSAIDAGRPYSTVLIESQGGIKMGVDLWVHRIMQILNERAISPMPQFITPTLKTLMRTTANASKMVRLREIAAYLENGLVRFAGERKFDGRTKTTYRTWIRGSGIEKLREALMTFDGTNCSDGIDALTQVIIINRTRIVNPNPTAKSKVEIVVKADSPMVAAMKRAMEQMKKDSKQKTDYQAEGEFFSAVSQRSVA